MFRSSLARSLSGLAGRKSLDLDAWIFLTESFDCFLISSLFVGSKRGGQPEFELSP